MIYGFKPQFVPFVLDGSKTHTVRAYRRDGKVEVPGKTTMHNYTGLRQKTATLLLRAPSVKVEHIVIEPGGIGIEIDGIRLCNDEKDLFAWRDGFRLHKTTAQSPGRAYEFMVRFWTDMHPGNLFKGTVSHWDYSRATDLNTILLSQLVSRLRGASANG